MDNHCDLSPPKSYLKRGLGATLIEWPNLTGHRPHRAHPVSTDVVGFSFLCSLTVSFPLFAMLPISLDKSRRAAEVESECHTSPNALYVSGWDTHRFHLPNTCSLACLIGIGENFSYWPSHTLYSCAVCTARL